jgi:zinc protease
MKSILCSLACLAAAAAQTRPAAKPIEIQLQQFKLDNGLRIVMSEDHSAPTVAVSVTYNVGSRDERRGRTGFAHLFEHMMFQGSENVGKGEHFILVENNGGEMNGTTNEDRTNYFQAFPANQLDLGLYLEADRMRSLAINQANLDNQRNAVQEERRIGIDNRAYGKTSEVLTEMAYDNFANQHSVIGSMEDLNAAQVKDVADFFKMYYAPNNAVLALVGDFKPEEALTKIKKYFGAIAAQPPPPKPDVDEKPQKAERRKTIEDPFAQAARVDVAYRIPPGNTDDWYALSVLSNALGAGQSSRLYQALVKDKELALAVFAAPRDRRGPGLLNVVALVRPGKDPKDAETAIYAEIEKLKTAPVAEWELEKVRLVQRRQTVQQFQSTLIRAVLVGQITVFYDDPNLINTRLPKVQAVTQQDVQRVARAYLTEANRTVVVTTPKAKSMAAPASTPKASN